MDDNMAIDEEQIRNWLMEEDLIREKIYDENANFHYIINFPNNNAMDIINPKTKEDVLIIGCATEVSQEEQNIIKSSPKDMNQEFIWKIRFSLNEMLLDLIRTCFESPSSNISSVMMNLVNWSFGCSNSKSRSISFSANLIFQMNS